jgi:hypothetical protein
MPARSGSGSTDGRPPRCATTPHGCCASDGVTPKLDANGSNCPNVVDVNPGGAPARGADTPCAERFRRFEGWFISGFNDLQTYNGVTWSECVDFCCASEDCVSFDWKPPAVSIVEGGADAMNCALQAVRASDVGAAYVQDEEQEGWAYTEKLPVEALEEAAAAAAGDGVVDAGERAVEFVLTFMARKPSHADDRTALAEWIERTVGAGSGASPSRADVIVGNMYPSNDCAGDCTKVDVTITYGGGTKPPSPTALSTAVDAAFAQSTTRPSLPALRRFEQPTLTFRDLRAAGGGAANRARNAGDGAHWGLCADERTPRVDVVGSNCPENDAGEIMEPEGCVGSRHGCCKDHETAKRDYRGTNCVEYNRSADESKDPDPINNPRERKRDSFGFDLVGAFIFVALAALVCWPVFTRHFEREIEREGAAQVIRDEAEKAVDWTKYEADYGLAWAKAQLGFGENGGSDGAGGGGGGARPAEGLGAAAGERAPLAPAGGQGLDYRALEDPGSPGGLIGDTRL